MQRDIATIIHNQLNTLMYSPPLVSRYSLLETQTDQYAAFNILTSAWKRVGEHEPNDPDPIISTAVDYINGQEWDAVDNDRNIRQHTNLPATLILQKGARVMYLDNDLFENGLYNGSIGIVIELINEDTVNVVFPAPLRMITATMSDLNKSRDLIPDIILTDKST
ncbi:12760_t:CDS:2 [Dentiscutata heterogama]|uniref:12760_t:CDS:1 n=1 Tax=Dentiscutata heterogama TaxID=1316150 RepID=A0ACA9LV40_9GLOM|nr:12760_t:CDS:2 [Dentiscutata heterogama]